MYACRGAEISRVLGHFLIRVFESLGMRGGEMIIRRRSSGLVFVSVYSLRLSITFKV